MLKNFINEELRIITSDYVQLRYWHIDNLASPYWRLYWPITSGAVIHLQAETRPLQPGTLMIIPPDTQFDGRTTHAFKKLYMHVVLPPLIRTRSSEILEVSISTSKQQEVLACAEALEKEEVPLFEAGARSTALVHWAMAELPPNYLDIGSSNERIDLAVETLQARLPHPIHNDDLAAIVGMNTHSFIRLFRQSMGETPQSFYTRLRINQACRMLHGGDDSIDQIAEATGFCDRYHFSRVFKKQRAMGPAAFRKLRDAAGAQ